MHNRIEPKMMEVEYKCVAGQLFKNMYWCNQVDPPASHAHRVNHLWSRKCEWQHFIPSINASVVTTVSALLTVTNLYDKVFMGPIAHDESLVLLIVQSFLHTKCKNQRCGMNSEMQQLQHKKDDIPLLLFRISQNMSQNVSSSSSAARVWASVWNNI